MRVIHDRRVVFGDMMFYISPMCIYVCVNVRDFCFHVVTLLSLHGFLHISHGIVPTHDRHHTLNFQLYSSIQRVVLAQAF